MSKMDAQRAMREANWAARQKKTDGPARKPATRPAAKPAAGPAAAPAPAPAAEPAAAAPATEGDACGHRSMNGRTCTRPAGHAEKNHRYS